MEWINFPNCEIFQWFCNKVRFFAPQAPILLPVKKNIKRGTRGKKDGGKSGDNKKCTDVKYR